MKASAPTGLHKFVILSVAKNLTSHKVKFSVGRGLAPAAEFPQTFAGDESLRHGFAVPPLFYKGGNARPTK